MSKRFQWRHPTSQRLISIEYDVEHTNKHNIVNLNHYSDQIVAISCHKLNSNWMEVYTSSYQQAVELYHSIFQNDTLLTGGREWLCYDQVIAQKVIRSFVRYGEKKILVVTQDIHPFQFFKHASARVVFGAFEDQNVQQTTIVNQQVPELHEIYQQSLSSLPHNKQTSIRIQSNDEDRNHPIKESLKSFRASSLKRQTRVGFSFGFIHKVFDWCWHAAQTIANEVANVVKTIVVIVGFLATGELNYHQSVNLPTISWNYNAQVEAAYNDSIILDVSTNCTNCFLNLVSDLHFDLDIENFEVRKKD
jgi:hypothetical protein